jgi:hypothetical protein
MIELLTNDGYIMYVERHILEYFDIYKAFLKIMDIMPVIPFAIPVYDKASMIVIFQLVKEYDDLCKNAIVYNKLDATLMYRLDNEMYEGTVKYKTAVDEYLKNKRLTIMFNNKKSILLIDDMVIKISNLYGVNSLINMICNKYKEYFTGHAAHIKILDSKWRYLKISLDMGDVRYC